MNYGLGMIMMYKRRFINCEKCTTLVEDVDSGRGYAYLGQRIDRKSSYLPRNFPMILKLLLKKSLKTHTQKIYLNKQCDCHTIF